MRQLVWAALIFWLLSARLLDISGVWTPWTARRSTAEPTMPPPGGASGQAVGFLLTKSRRLSAALLGDMEDRGVSLVAGGPGRSQLCWPGNALAITLMPILHYTLGSQSGSRSSQCRRSLLTGLRNVEGTGHLVER